MAADIAQELDIAEFEQPVGIVGHDGVLCTFAKIKKIGELLLDAFDVVRDALDGQKLAGLVLEGGITDHAGAAAHQRDGTMAGLLHPVQHHDLHEMADMERCGRRIVPDVSGHDLGRELLVEPVGIRNLMNEATLGERIEKFGFELGHWS